MVYFDERGCDHETPPAGDVVVQPVTSLVPIFLVTPSRVGAEQHAARFQRPPQFFQDPVWTLLDQTYRIHGARPTLLERDFNIPPLDELVWELQRIDAIQTQHANNGHVVVPS